MKKSNTKKCQVCRIPKAAEYYFKYRKKNGRIYSYHVSNPVKLGHLITGWAQYKGVRTFVINNILECRKLDEIF